MSVLSIFINIWCPCSIKVYISFLFFLKFLFYWPQTWDLKCIYILKDHYHIKNCVQQTLTQPCMQKSRPRQSDHNFWNIQAEGTIKIPKCVNVLKRLRLHDKAWCTFLEEMWKGRNTQTLSNVVPLGCSGQGYTFSLTVFLFQLLVSLQLNDGYLFHVSNPLNIEPTLCHMQFQLLTERRINSESRIIFLCLLQGQSRAT